MTFIIHDEESSLKMVKHYTSAIYNFFLMMMMVKMRMKTMMLMMMMVLSPCGEDERHLFKHPLRVRDASGLLPSLPPAKGRKV